MWLEAGAGAIEPIGFNHVRHPTGDFGGIGIFGEALMAAGVDCGRCDGGQDRRGFRSVHAQLLPASAIASNCLL